ncbi:MAG: NAD-dependent epimerase/dehydratase family protein [Candidatus Aminicenantes bacterium]|nr:MAG: NAD-dependent epimerase/dehydratase family protein [Candidatus Aminicenantes bacterium]
MKILVTGATGFVGNVLLDELPKSYPEAQISAFVMPGDPFENTVSPRKGFRIIRGDITKQEDVFQAVQGHTHVIHLAGLISYSQQDKKPLMEVNVKGVQNIVEACLHHGILRLIHISSVGACGFYKDGKLADEETFFNWPQNFHYMTSKHLGQKIVEQACKEKGLPAVILLPASIIGPGDPDITTPHNQLYERIYKKGLFGCFSGGLAVVDVRDLVEIILKALESKVVCEKCLVVGSNVKYTDVVKAIAKYGQKRNFPFPVPALLLSALGRILEYIGKITKSKPLLTYAYGKLSGWTVYYSNEKSKREFDHEYRSFEKSIADSCRYFEDNFLD